MSIIIEKDKINPVSSFKKGGTYLASNGSVLMVFMEEQTTTNRVVIVDDCGGIRHIFEGASLEEHQMLAVNYLNECKCTQIDLKCKIEEFVPF